MKEKVKAKFIFVTGGVVSSLGKGISAAMLGRILKKRGLQVFMMKFDPYINIDPGTMSPYQHGEVFVTADGGETDLDLGHYERYVGINLTKDSSVSAGKIYASVIDKERKGEYLGATIQVVPHITDEIKSRMIEAANNSLADIVIIEIGGTVGDIESLPFLEAIRQARADFGYENTMYIHNTLVPYLKTSEEIKTKPTQHSVKELLGHGIQPDCIILRSEVDIDDSTREKIASFCNVPLDGVYVCKDVKVIYDVALSFQKQGLDEYVLHHFRFRAPIGDLSDWKELSVRIKKIKNEVRIALVGKYVQLHDAYLSVCEALKHAGYSNKVKVNVDWIDATSLTLENLHDSLKHADGILVPGGFGQRAAEGKKLAIKYARENNIPLLGICYGLQIACVEYAQNVLGIEDANSTEIDPNTKNPIVDYLPNQYKGVNLGGTMRLGVYDCKLIKNSKAHQAYGKLDIHDRHRHRYEFNLKYKKVFDDGNFLISGTNPQTGLVEVIELKNHPWFVCCQFHPEFRSRPLKPHPLFREFVSASITNRHG